MSPSLIPSACLSLVLLVMARAPEPLQGRRELIPPAAQGTDAILTGKYDLAQTGIDWVEGLDAALGRGKPILLFQLLGRFDDALC